ncbi:MAG: hypothetical protein KKH99_14740, partial [Proteobacteria bacterium]|nr:hypothetical protein [Pseudomonadota bacterium]
KLKSKVYRADQFLELRSAFYTLCSTFCGKNPTPTESGLGFLPELSFVPTSRDDIFLVANFTLRGSFFSPY